MIGANRDSTNQQQFTFQDSNRSTSSTISSFHSNSKIMSQEESQEATISIPTITNSTSRGAGFSMKRLFLLGAAVLMPSAQAAMIMPGMDPMSMGMGGMNPMMGGMSGLAGMMGGTHHHMDPMMGMGGMGMGGMPPMNPMMGGMPAMMGGMNPMMSGMSGMLGMGMSPMNSMNPMMNMGMHQHQHHHHMNPMMSMGMGGMPPMNPMMGGGMPPMNPMTGGMPTMGGPVGYKYQRGRKRGFLGMGGRDLGRWKPIYHSPGMDMPGMGPSPQMGGGQWMY